MDDVPDDTLARISTAEFRQARSRAAERHSNSPRDDEDEVCLFVSAVDPSAGTTLSKQRSREMLASWPDDAETRSSST